jgi:hypothetical protein
MQHLRQPQRPSGSLEQAAAQPFFEPGHALADRRHGEVQTLRSRREAAEVGGGYERVDAFQTFRWKHQPVPVL